MKTWLIIALRNLKKNKRRSLFTIFAIALGFAAINIFGGFTSYVFSGLQNSYIYTKGNGHISIYKNGYRKSNKNDIAKFLISKKEASAIKNITNNIPEIILTNSQLSFSGLLSNGEISTVYIARGEVASNIKKIKNLAPGKFSNLKSYIGKPLDDNKPFGIGVSSGLAELLGLNILDTAIAMAPTIEGQVNAMDVEIVQTFNIGIETLNDKVMLVPLGFAQSLYDTNAVEKIIILLNDGNKLNTVTNSLKKIFRERDLDIEVRTWKEEASFHKKVKTMFNVIFLFIFIIVMVIVIMSVVNTISMAVLERIREIGTLRALGVKNKGIVILFSIESLLLGLFGAILGILLVLVFWLGINFFEPKWTPPQITQKIPLEIHIVPEYLLFSIIFMTLLSMFTAIFPARKAGKMCIIDALGHH